MRCPLGCPPSGQNMVKIYYFGPCSSNTLSPSVHSWSSHLLPISLFTCGMWQTVGLEHRPKVLFNSAAITNAIWDLNVLLIRHVTSVQGTAGTSDKNSWKIEPIPGNTRGNSKGINTCRIHTSVHANTTYEHFAWAELDKWCFDEPDSSECDI